MATAVSPIKIDAEHDRLAAHAAHFLRQNKKDVVEAGVRLYIDAHRDEINAAVHAALRELDDSPASNVSLLTGMSKDRLDELGGIPELD